MSALGDFWNKIKTAASTEEAEIEGVFNTLEQKLLPGFLALVKQIESTIGEQGVTILEEGITQVVTAIEQGGNVNTAVSAAVSPALQLAESDLKQDGLNAAHGALFLLLAALAPKSTVSSVPSAVNSTDVHG